MKKPRRSELGEDAFYVFRRLYLVSHLLAQANERIRPHRPDLADEIQAQREALTRVHDEAASIWRGEGSPGA